MVEWRYSRIRVACPAGGEPRLRGLLVVGPFREVSSFRPAMRSETAFTLDR